MTMFPTLADHAPPLRDPVAVARAGNCFLLIERADFEAKNWDGLACIHDLDAAEPRLSPTQWARIWPKWIVFEDATDAEYREALKEKTR
jgi:hypothetical protein